MGLIQKPLRCVVPPSVEVLLPGPASPAKWSQEATPLVFIMIAMLTPGYPTFHHLGDLTTSLTSPPPPPSLTSSQILLSPQFIFRSLETLSVIRTNYKCDCPSYVSLNTNSSTNSHCTLHRCTSFAELALILPLRKENSPSWPSLDIR